MDPDQDPASVRIEFESGPPSALDTLLGESSSSNGDKPKRPRGLLVGAALVAAFVVGTLLLLSPSDDEAADGSRRGTTTTTVAPSSTTEQSSTSTTAPTSVDGVQLVPAGEPTVATEVVDIRGLPQIPVEIIAGGGGYVALGQSDGTAVGPVLYGSPTGESWVRFVRGLAPEVLSEPTETVDVQYSYHAIAAIEDGLAVSLLERFVDRESEETTNIRVKRLTTSDGSTWTIDPDFLVVEVDAVAALPTFNGPDVTAVAVLPEGQENPLIGDVVRQWVSDPLVAAGCWVDAFPQIGIGGGEPGFRLQSCDFQSIETIETSQLIDPELVGELQECLQQLGSRSAAFTDIHMQRREDATVRIYSVGTVASTPVLIGESNTAAALVPGTSLMSAPACGPFDRPATAPVDPGIAVFGPGDGSVRISSQGLLGTQPLFLERLPIAANEDQVLMPLLGSVYSIDLDAGEWALEARAARSTDPIYVAPNGRQIFTFRGSSMYHAVVGEPWEQLGIDRMVRRPLVLHADDERVFFNDGLDTLMIALPNS